VDSAKALMDAVEEYKKSYGQEPRYRHILSALDRAMHEAQRLAPEKTSSPGARAALQAATGRLVPPPSSPPPPQPAGAVTASPGSPGSRWPVDYASARQAASERLAGTSEAA
jgi:hypothetical protein